MPELPEVETIRRGLEKKISGRAIKSVRVYFAKAVKMPSRSAFVRDLTGRKITGVGRRGKFLIIKLNGPRYLFVHLRMTGQLVMARSRKPLSKHTRVVFGLSRGEELRFIDMRKFGCLYLVKEREDFSSWHKLGPEPLDGSFSRAAFGKILSGRRTKIKQLLMDQNRIAGLGNIYAAEALFRAGIHPARPAGELNEGEITALSRAVKKVLKEAIACCGTTLSDYVTSSGAPGNFFEKLKIYGDKKTCVSCRKPIKSIKLSGRGTNFCPCCQR